MSDWDLDGDMSENARQEADKIAQSISDYNKLIARVFSTEDGEKLSTIWLERYIMQPTVIAGNPIEAHGIKEGQAGFVRMIFKTVEAVKTNYGRGD